MDIDVTGKQNGLPYNAGDWAATARTAQPAPDTTSTASDSSGTGTGGAAASSSTSTGKAYESPIMKIDPETGAAVLSFLNPGTDQQAFQVPSRSALEYERQQRLTMPAEKTGGTTGTS